MRIEHHANGPRFYVLGLRVHHGLTGCVLVLLGLARSELRLVRLGALLVLDDVHDFPWRLREPCFTEQFHVVRIVKHGGNPMRRLLHGLSAHERVRTPLHIEERIVVTRPERPSFNMAAHKLPQR